MAMFPISVTNVKFNGNTVICTDNFVCFSVLCITIFKISLLLIRHGINYDFVDDR